jgi:hypothetical protein
MLTNIFDCILVLGKTITKIMYMHYVYNENFAKLKVFVLALLLTIDISTMTISLGHDLLF